MLYKQYFNSINELRSFIASTSPNGYYSDREDSHKDGREFFGTVNFDAADKLLQYGWQDGANKVNAYMAQSKQLGYMPRWTRNVDYVGGSVSIGRYLTGQPKCRVAIKKRPVAAPVVDICYNASVSAMISTSEIEAAAAKLLNVVCGMERCGVRVNLYVCRHTELNRAELLTCVKIKDAGQPFNVLSTAYPLAHPSMLRRHFFAVQERANIGYKHGHGCYGQAIDNGEKTKSALQQIGINAKNVLNFYTISNKTEKDIADMLI